jgi:hypothetical protein
MKKPTLIHFKAMADRKTPRLPPPDSLSDAQKAVWHQTVGNLPPAWFSLEQTSMLVAYCGHVCRAAQIEAALSGLDPLGDLEQFDKLTKLAAGESAKIAMFARSMRLTQQSRLKAETAQSHAAGAASAAAAGDPPWMFGGANQFVDDLIAR